VLARVCVALVAVAVLGWLGVMERDARLQARGLEAASRLDVAGNPARAEASFRGARLLNPDTAPDLSRALVHRAAGRQREAAALVEDVLRREPDNLTAWSVLYTMTRGRDAAAARRALAARRRLDPVNARPR
jgi:tetratricopeptide (TPR) repeat protein